MTQQPYQQAPQQPYPPFPPQQNPYPQVPQANPTYGANPVAVPTLAGPEATLDQSGPGFIRLSDLDGRLVFILPKTMAQQTDPKYPPRIICDVVFFDGAPITHTVSDGKATPLVKPVHPGELIEDLYVGGSRIVKPGSLLDWVGRGQGFARRVGKDGNAVVLLDVDPQSQAYVGSQLADVYARAAAARAQANPIAQAAQAAAQPQQQYAQPVQQQYAAPAVPQQPQAPAQPAAAPAPVQPAAFDPNQWQAAQQQGQGQPG